MSISSIVRSYSGAQKPRSQNSAAPGCAWASSKAHSRSRPVSSGAARDWFVEHLITAAAVPAHATAPA
jgi:hypothetical protein